MKRAATPAASTAARAASIHARLLNRAKERGEDFNLLLTRFAIERLLYRLSISSARDQFLLKGALLFDLWFDVPHRPTRDADFLGFGPPDAAVLTQTIRDVCVIEADDAVSYDPTTVTTSAIRDETNYGGLRVNLIGRLGKARSTLQLDVGYGDAVTPRPTEMNLPGLLDDLPAPRLRVYPRETVVAEKFEAIASLGIANSRMKDYFDLRALLREGRMDSHALSEAIAATFRRRSTALPRGMPLGLTSAFSSDGLKQKQWAAFLGKNRLQAPSLADVVADVAAGLEEPLARALEIAAAPR